MKRGAASVGRGLRLLDVLLTERGVCKVHTHKAARLPNALLEEKYAQPKPDTVLGYQTTCCACLPHTEATESKGTPG